MSRLKEFVDMGGSLKLPYKAHDVLEWYCDIGIFLSRVDEKYMVHRMQCFAEFDDFEDAWEEFEKYRFNIGVLQLFVSRENPDREDIEYEPEWWRDAINKKADELGVPRPDWKTWDDEKEEWV